MSTRSLSDSDSRDRQLDEAIMEFLRANEEGVPLDLAAFLRKHENIADELQEFIGQQRQFRRMMSPAREFAALANPTEDKLPDCIGDYKIISEIGRGGMGVIYEASQIGFKRRIALKMIRDSRFRTREDLIRFQAEAEAAVALDHPNIVPVYHVGNVDGHPFFTMKLIKGGSLKQALQDGPFQAQEAACVCLEIAKAVSFAHQRGILHRDLKPANILLDSSSTSQHSGAISDSSNSQSYVSDNVAYSKSSSSFQDQRSTLIPLISDFGLAKQLNEDLDQGLTMTGAVLGTPSFMSPEQAAGETALTTSADVYGVGAILYNMLTGTPPFEGTTPVEITRKVIEQTPRLVGSQSNVDLDLQTICMKCLEKEPQHRYLSAGDLADDLQRYLQGQPILARRSSAAEQVLKWARRNRAMAALFSAIAALLMVTLIGAIAFSVRLNSEVTKRGETLEDLQRQEAQTSEQRDHAVRRLFESKFAEVAARRSSGENGQRFEALAAAKEAVMQLPFISATEKEIFELRSETAGCLGNADIVQIAAWQVEGSHRTIAFSPDLSLFATHGEAGKTLGIYRTEELQSTESVERATQLATVDVGLGVVSGPLRCKFSNCGGFLSVNTLYDGVSTQTVYDVVNDKLIFQEEGITFACIGEFDSGKFLATAGQEISILSLPGLEPVITFENPSPSSNNLMEFSPDGKWLARFGHGLFVMEVGTGEVVWRNSESFFGDLDWHPDRPEFATCADTEVQIWRMDEKPRLLRSFPDHTREVFQVEYTPDGTVVAASTWGDTTRFWDTQSGEQICSLAGILDRFSGDGTKLGFQSVKSGICKFENNRLRKTISKADSRHIGSQPIDLAVHPNNRWVALGEKKDVRICDLKTGTWLVDLPGEGRVRFHPDGSCLFVGNTNVKKWPIKEERLPDGKLKLTIGPPRKVLDWKTNNQMAGLDIDPTGSHLGGIVGGSGFVVDITSKDKKLVLMKNSPSARGISLSANGRLVAVGNHIGQNAQVFDGASGELIHTINTPGHARATLSPDGKLLAVAFSRTSEVYETKSWKRLYTLRDTDFEVAWPTSFSHDNKYLLFTLRKPRGTLIVDAQTGKRLIRIPGAAGTAPRDARSLLTTDEQLVTIKEGNSIESWDLGKIRKQLRAITLDWDVEDLASPEIGREQFVSTQPAEIKESVSYEPPIVEVIWEESRLSAYKRAMSEIRSLRGDRVLTQAFEDWQSDHPEDPVLWHAMASVKLKYNESAAYEDLTKAIQLSTSAIDPELYLLRGRLGESINRRDLLISDLGNFLDSNFERPAGRWSLFREMLGPFSGKASDLRMRESQRLAWHLALTQNKHSGIETALKLATDFEKWVAEHEQASPGSRDAELLRDRVLANKTLGLALIQANKFGGAIEYLESITPQMVEQFAQDCYGIEFLMAAAYAGNMEFEMGQRRYTTEVKTDFRPQWMTASKANDWRQLRKIAERALEIKREVKQRWSPIELAASCNWDIGSVRIQFFKTSRRFVDPGVSDEFVKTNNPVQNLFWNPQVEGGRLTLNLEIEESGTYDGRMNLCHSWDYGLIEFELNGQPVGQRYDGRLDAVVFGSGVEFKKLKLRKGTNKLTLINVGKSTKSRGFFAGIESLELIRK